jgi:hypothetical protein
MLPDSDSAGFSLPASLWPAVALLATGALWPPSGPEAAERFVERAEVEGLLPLLFGEVDPPALVAAALEKRRAVLRVHELRVAVFRATAARLAEVLAGEPFLFLKGCDYAWRLYTKPELRPMQDIDILVRSDRIDAVTARLLHAGFPRGYPAGPVSRTAGHYERVFDLGPVRLDVHQAFLPSWRLRVDYRSVWNRRVPFDGPCQAFRLSDLDALVYHAVAMAKDELTVPLGRFVDLWLMLRREPGLLGPALDRARDWRARRALYGALAGARRIFPELAQFVSERDLGCLLDSRARRFLDRRVLPRPGSRAGDARWPRATQLWRKFWLIEGFPRRAAFALSHAAAVLRGRAKAAAASRNQPMIPGPSRGA